LLPTIYGTSVRPLLSPADRHCSRWPLLPSPGLAPGARSSLPPRRSQAVRHCSTIVAVWVHGFWLQSASGHYVWETCSRCWQLLKQPLEDPAHSPLASVRAASSPPQREGVAGVRAFSKPPDCLWLLPQPPGSGGLVFQPRVLDAHRDLCSTVLPLDCVHCPSDTIESPWRATRGHTSRTCAGSDLDTKAVRLECSSRRTRCAKGRASIPQWAVSGGQRHWDDCGVGARFATASDQLLPASVNGRGCPSPAPRVALCSALSQRHMTLTWRCVVAHAKPLRQESLPCSRGYPMSILRHELLTAPVASCVSPTPSRASTTP